MPTPIEVLKESQKEFGEAVETFESLTFIKYKEKLQSFLPSLTIKLLESEIERLKEEKKKCAGHTLDEMYCFDCGKCIEDEKTHAWQYGAGINDQISYLESQLSEIKKI